MKQNLKSFLTFDKEKKHITQPTFIHIKIIFHTCTQKNNNNFYIKPTSEAVYILANKLTFNK